MVVVNCLKLLKFQPYLMSLYGKMLQQIAQKEVTRDVIANLTLPPSPEHQSYDHPLKNLAWVVEVQA